MAHASATVEGSRYSKSRMRWLNVFYFLDAGNQHLLVLRALAHGHSRIDAPSGGRARLRHRGVERRAGEARNHDQVAVGLHARAERPFDLGGTADIDVVVDDRHLLET